MVLSQSLQGTVGQLRESQWVKKTTVGGVCPSTLILYCWQESAGPSLPFLLGSFDAVADAG